MKLHRAIFTSVFLTASLTGNYAFASDTERSIFPFGHIILIFVPVALIALLFLIVMLAIRGYEKLSGIQKGMAIVLILIIGCVTAYEFIIKYTHLLEMEVNDEYIAGLFAPASSYETLRVTHSIDGKKYVVIEMYGEVTRDKFNEYRQGLLKRGLNVHGYGVTMTRKAEDDPDAIELSTIRFKEYQELFRGREIRMPLDKDTGRQWRRERIIPEKEPETVELIARYPGARLKEVYMDEYGNARWIYAVRGASLEQAYHFYTDMLGESIKINRRNPTNPDSPGRDCFTNELFHFSRHEDSKIITLSRCVDIRASNDESRSVEIYIRQSRDPNLDDFTEITICGNIKNR